MTIEDDQPGQYFTWAEMTTTSTSLPNIPTTEDRQRIRLLVAKVLDPIRRYIGRPVRVCSGYRSEGVNAAIGGSPTSAHRYGLAADIKVRGLTAAELVAEVVASGVPFDQLIGYDEKRGGHVHIGLSVGKHVNGNSMRNDRRQVLWAPTTGGYKAYTP